MPPDFWSLTTCACCGCLLRPSATEEKTRAGTTTIIKCFVILRAAHRLEESPGSLSLATALPCLLELFEKPRRTFAIEGSHDVAFPLFLAEFDRKSLAPELRGLLLFASEPARIHFSRVHVNTHLRESSHPFRRRFVEKSGKASHRPEILRIERRDMKSAQSAIRDPGDMKLVLQNLEITEKLDDKRGKYAIAALEEEVPVRRSRGDDDVAQIFRLLAPISEHRSFDHPHRLWPTAKSENSRIRLRRIIAIRKNNFVFQFGPRNIRGLIENVRGQGLAQEHHCGNSHGIRKSQSTPKRVRHSRALLTWMADDFARRLYVNQVVTRRAKLGKTGCRILALPEQAANPRKLWPHSRKRHR